MKQKYQFAARITLTSGYMVDPRGGANERNIIHRVYYQTNIWMWQGYRKSEKDDEVNIQPDYGNEVLIGNKHIKTWFGRPRAGLTKTKTVSEYKQKVKRKMDMPWSGFYLTAPSIWFTSILVSLGPKPIVFQPAPVAVWQANSWHTNSVEEIYFMLFIVNSLSTSAIPASLNEGTTYTPRRRIFPGRRWSDCPAQLIFCL